MFLLERCFTTALIKTEAYWRKQGVVVDGVKPLQSGWETVEDDTKIG